MCSTQHWRNLSLTSFFPFFSYHVTREVPESRLDVGRTGKVELRSQIGWTSEEKRNKWSSCFASWKEWSDDDEIDDEEKNMPITCLARAVLEAPDPADGSEGSLCRGIFTVCFEVVQRSSLASSWDAVSQRSPKGAVRASNRNLEWKIALDLKTEYFLPMTSFGNGKINSQKTLL